MIAESRRLAAVQAPIIPVIADLIRAHPGTLSLGQGVVSYTPPPQVFEAIGRFAAEPANHKYQHAGGIPPLLGALAQTLATDHAIATGPAHGNAIMVTAGGNQAFLNAVLALGDPGDEFILPVPYYFNHEMAITMASCRAVLVPTDAHYQPEVDRLRAAITPRTRAIVTVSPNNPSGAVYPEATLRAINALCADRGIMHISDEAYASFTYDGARHFSAASLPGVAAHTISLFSLSKAYGFASWRIGWMVFPKSLEAALRKIQDTIVICPPVISQHAAVGALAAGAPFVREKLRELAEVRAIVQRELAPLAADGIASIPPADGAFYFLLRANTTLPPLEAATRLIRDHGVAVIPGNAFGLDHGCHLRVAYGALEKATATEGLGRLARGLRAMTVK